jgi:integrase
VTHGGPTVLEYASLFGDEATNPRALELKAAGMPYSPATIADYRQRMHCHLEPDKAFASLHISEVTQPLLVAYLGRLLDSLGGESCRTYQHVWIMLHTIFAQYTKDNPGYDDPFTNPKKLPKPRYNEQIRGALTESELRHMFDEVGFPDPLEAAACSLAFWAGLRRGEIFALKWDDVDFVQHRLVVSRAMKKFGYADRSEGSTKGRKTRIVPMVEYVEKALKALPRVGEYVIVFPDGSRPLTKWWGTTVDHAFIRSGIDAKARNITPHSSRHSIASVLLSRGVPKDYIRLILGHFDERTTDGYLHMAAEEIDKMTKKMNVGK